MTDSTPSPRSRLRVLAPLLLGAGLVALVVWSPWSGSGGGSGSEVGGSLRDAEAPADRIRAVARLGEFAVSTVTVPVSYDADRVLGDLESLIPSRFGALSERRPLPSFQGVEYAFQAQRGPFEATIQGDTVRVTTMIRYGGQVWYQTPFGIELTASCGVAGSDTATDAPRAVLTLSSPIEIRDDWSLRSNVTVDRLEPAGESDQCIIDVLQLQLDATDAIMIEARAALEREAEAIDRALAQVEIRPFLESYWATMQQPVSIAPGTWLTLNPEGVHFASGPASAGSTSSSLHGRLEITARPRVVVGRRPAAPTGSFPVLASGPSARGNDLVVEGRADYDALSSLASDLLEGQGFRIAGRSLRVHDVRVAGSGNGKISVDLEVEGGVQGTIHLLGTPAFDPGSGELSFPDLEYSVEGGRMVRLTAWALRVFLPGYVRERLRWPLGDLLESDGLFADRGLDVRFGEEARLEGTLGDVEVTEMAATDAGLIVRSRIETNALLRIGPESTTQ